MVKPGDLVGTEMNKRKIMARIALENFKAQAKKLTPKQDRTAGTAKPSPTADVNRFQPPTKGKLTRTHLDHVADVDDDGVIETAPLPRIRHTVYTARYRLVQKGPERGKWEADVVA